MDRIKALYGAFSKYEQRIFKTYLSAFHNKGENKSLQLIELVEKDPEISLENASQVLYENPKSKAFLMMKARVFEKMTEFLSLSISVSAGDRDEIDPLNLALLEYRKSMLFALSLRMRGLKGLASDFLERALEIAREVTCPELEVDPLLRLKAINARGGNTDENNELFTELADVMGRLDTDLNSIAIYHHLVLQFNMKTGHETQRLKYLEDNIPQLEEMLARKYSVRAEYYLLLLKIQLFRPREMYRECKDAIMRLIEMVTDYKGLQNKERISTPYMLLGILESREGNYEAAMKPLNQALGLSTTNPALWIGVQVRRAYVLLYSGQHEEVGRLLAEMLNRDALHFSFVKPEQNSLFQYLQSCLFYFEKKVEKAWQKMQNITEVNFDKAGWNTGYRIFDVMLLIEMGERSFASMKLENLRKHIAKYDIDARSVAIHKILTAMEKNDFSFSPIPDEEQVIADMNEKTPWDMHGHEVVRFDHWYCRHRGLPLP